MLGAADGDGHGGEAGTTAVADERIPREVVDRLLATPLVRPGVVARAKANVASGTWCRAEEVAAELVDCYVKRRLP